jgi:hypothetical protein
LSPYRFADKLALAKGSTDGSDYGIYGTKGTESDANVPTARYKHQSWTDSAGNMYVFGGLDPPEGGTFGAPMDDMWKYASSTGKWTWLAGSMCLSGVGNCSDTAPVGTLGAGESALNTPGARMETSGFTIGTDLYLFGGCRTAYGQNVMNDMWKFSTTSGQWSWVAGDGVGFSMSGTDGSGTQTRGTSYAADNTPAGRRGGLFITSPGMTATDEVYFMGGFGTQAMSNKVWNE